MRTFLRGCFMLLFMLSFAHTQPVSQWRGPERNGVYPESELLKKWPADGPAQLWFSEGLGLGFSSVAVTEHAIYATGKKSWAQK